MSVNKKSDLTTLKRVIKLAKPHRLSFWVSIFLSLALAGINAVQPIFVKRTIDLAIDNYEYNKVFLLALSVFGLILLAAVLRYFFIYIIILTLSLTNTSFSAGTSSGSSDSGYTKTKPNAFGVATDIS